MDSGARFNARYKKAKARADQWSAILEACFYYAVPFRNRFWKPENNQGTFNNAYLFDSTGVEATKTFVSKIHTVMCPPQVQWGFLSVDLSDATVGSMEQDDINAAQQILDEYMRRVFKYIHKSNFDIIASEAFFDMAVGTGCIVCNQYIDKDPLLWTSVPVDQLAIEEAMDGKVRTWFRTWENFKINELNLRWKNAVLNADLEQRVADDPNATCKIIEGVTFNPENFPSGKPYQYRVCTESSGTDPLLEEDLEINPATIWRFAKTNNEWWGRGPVMDALPAMMRANEMAKIEFASANLNTFRPYMAFSDSIFNPHTFKLKPMAIIPIARLGSNGQVPLIPLPDSSNPQFGQMTLIDLRTQINNLMYADPLGPVDAPARTATEMALRQQNLAEKIGPLFTRLQQELLWPILEVSMHYLDKMGIVKKPKIKGVSIAFEYRSPLALAKGQQDLAVLTQYVQIMQGIMGPDVTQLLINNQVAPYVAADMVQLDKRFLNSPEEIKRIAQQMLEQQQEMQQQQQEMQQQEMQQQQQEGVPGV